MPNPILLYQIALWINSIGLIVFFMIEIFWFVKQKQTSRDLPSLVLGFFIYNLPFLVLATSMYVQDIPGEAAGIARLVFLVCAIPLNLLLHYHGDKGGNSVGMLVVFFLIGAVPLVAVMEIIIAFG